MSSLAASDIITYIDDVISHHRDLGQHEKRLREVFDLFREYNVSVNSSKACIAHSSVFCGHRISKNGMEMLTRVEQESWKITKVLLHERVLSDFWQ